MSADTTQSVDLFALLHERLSEVTKPEGAEIWLHTENRLLDGKRPFDAIYEAQRVFDLIESLTGMVAT